MSITSTKEAYFADINDFNHNTASRPPLLAIYICFHRSDVSVCLGVVGLYSSFWAVNLLLFLSQFSSPSPFVCRLSSKIFDGTGLFRYRLLASKNSIDSAFRIPGIQKPVRPHPSPRIPSSPRPESQTIIYWIPALKGSHPQQQQKLSAGTLLAARFSSVRIYATTNIRNLWLNSI